MKDFLLSSLRDDQITFHHHANFTRCCFLQFVKFANIEEDTPSYHRSYDFFVSRFSEMCHSEDEDFCTRNKSENSFCVFLQLFKHFLKASDRVKCVCVCGGV